MTDGKALPPLLGRLGVGAGRIAPAGFDPEGTYAFVLGSDEAGVRRTLVAGDFFEVDQIADLTTTDIEFVRVRTHLRPPTLPLPGTYAWAFSILLDSASRVSHTLSREVSRNDFAIPTATASGTRQRITYRLALGGSHMGTGAEITAYDGTSKIATLVATSSTFTSAALGRVLKITAASDADDIGEFVITEVVSTTTVKVEIPAAGAGVATGVAWEVLRYEFELPAIYLDTLALDAQDALPGLINRVPEPSETGVPLASTVTLEISDSRNTNAGGLGPITGETSVYVNGVLAWSAGAFQAGFSGSSALLDGNRTRQIVITPSAAFPPLTDIPIRVVSRVPDVFPGIDTTYTFTTADTVAPTLSSATALDHMTIEVGVSEALLAEDAAGSADALNPANWTIAIASTSLADGLPAMPLDVVSVDQAGPTTFALTVDTEMTRGALYSVTAAGIQDLFGNAFVAPNNTATFTGYTCPVPERRRFSLLGMLPALNVEEDATEDLAKFIACFQEVADLLLCSIDRWIEILDPDTAPERFVDAMLADLGNPFDFVLSAVDKRRLVQVLVPIYGQKGTDAGIINAVRFFFGIEVSITTPAFDGVWFLGVSELGFSSVLGTSDTRSRYSFTIVSPISLTETQREQITKIANYMRDGRTHLTGILEPAIPIVPDHLELGLSELGVSWVLH